MAPVLKRAWSWLGTHKALTALIFVLLTLVPALPEWKIVDQDGRDGGEIIAFICSKVPQEWPHRSACSDAVESQIRLSLMGEFRDKRPVLPGLLLKRRKARVFDYDVWKRDYPRFVEMYRATAARLDRAYPAK